MWESLDRDKGIFDSYRMAVPGGWLVVSTITYNCTYKEGAGAGISQIFISDPEHSWVLAHNQ